MIKVFLGGTCNESTWRDDLIKLLEIDYFNPVVDDWSEECMREEIKQRQECDYCLYVITPKMAGVYSIAEVVDDSNKRPDKTLFCFLGEDRGEYFNEGQIKSLAQVAKMVCDNGGRFFCYLENIAEFLNEQLQMKKCDNCINRKSILCPNSSECYALDDKPRFEPKVGNSVLGFAAKGATKISEEQKKILKESFNEHI